MAFPDALASAAVDPTEEAMEDPDLGSRLPRLSLWHQRGTRHFLVFSDSDDEGSFYGFGLQVPGKASSTNNKVQKTEPQKIDQTKTTCETEDLEFACNGISRHQDLGRLYQRFSLLNSAVTKIKLQKYNVHEKKLPSSYWVRIENFERRLQAC